MLPLNVALNKAKGILGCTGDERCQNSMDTEQDPLTRLPSSLKTAINIHTPDCDQKEGRSSVQWWV